MLVLVCPGDFTYRKELGFWGLSVGFIVWQHLVFKVVKIETEKISKKQK